MLHTSFCLQSFKSPGRSLFNGTEHLNIFFKFSGTSNPFRYSSIFLLLLALKQTVFNHEMIIRRIRNTVGFKNVFDLSISKFMRIKRHPLNKSIGSLSKFFLVFDVLEPSRFSRSNPLWGAGFLTTTGFLTRDLTFLLIDFFDRSLRAGEKNIVSKHFDRVLGFL